ncbi:hypothetical protein [Meiothermus granaticius]|uniref:Uncharacterized protein n=1 Tax=Meiothermus granaticius NBRC 107808 TaxID=1227551 RepID=A0A399FCK9_9DEIN|nr:hypothetical protein [Meiothermus granaticius]RIH93980.1 hypothetical protein Mgrana_00066 [Meiothermus granaticius NBRC 107808]GEM88191.1 hypothetical protein MGR01S_28160 [Meiothermus granaticius NBRC 107808]
MKDLVLLAIAMAPFDAAKKAALTQIATGAFALADEKAREATLGIIVAEINAARKAIGHT